MIRDIKSYGKESVASTRNGKIVKLFNWTHTSAKCMSSNLQPVNDVMQGGGTGGDLPGGGGTERYLQRGGGGGGGGVISLYGGYHQGLACCLVFRLRRDWTLW